MGRDEWRPPLFAPPRPERDSGTVRALPVGAALASATFARDAIAGRLLDMDLPDPTASMPRITSDPKVMMGKPCVAGTRITVETILNRFAEDYSLDELLDDYPVLTREAVEAALTFAARRAALPDKAIVEPAAE